MPYQVVIASSAEREIKRLPQTIRHRILEKIAELSDNPRPRGCKKLKGRKDEYRIRIGKYRAIYGIDDTEKRVIILHCMHRRDIYRK